MMRTVHTLSRGLLPALLALVVLRALVPVGYMPAAAGSGLLLELCHESVPAGFLQAPTGDHTHAGHSGHGAHGQGDHQSMAESCSFGHLLSQAAVESATDLDPAIPNLAAPFVTEPFGRPELAPRYRHDPRGPPRA